MSSTKYILDSVIIRMDDKPTPGTLAQYNGNARPGEIVIDPTTFPPTMWLGDKNGNLNLVGAGGGGGNAPYANVAGYADGAGNANYANYAGNAVFSTLAANANYAANAGNAAFATTAANANYAANSGNANYAANAGNALNANYANFAGQVVDGAQPNITSVGTLVSLTVGGNATAANFVTSGNVVAGNVNSDRVVGGAGGLTLETPGTQDIVLAAGGNINAAGNPITNLPLNPTNPLDAVSKNYVDNVAQGLRPKAPAQAASASNLVGVYNNGAAGVGATLTLGTPLTVLDGYALNAGDRVLVFGQTAQSQNGIYTYTNSTTLTRATDTDATGDFPNGTFVFVENGSTYGKSGWALTTAVTTIGVDSVVWQQISSAGNYTNGTGLSLAGSVFSITPTAVTPSTYGNGDRVAQFTVNQQGQLTGATNVPITANAANLTGDTLSPTVLFSSLKTVGTLNSLNVSGPISLGSASNLTITGGAAGQVLGSSGGGAVSWVTPANGTVTNIATATADNSGMGFSLTGGPITTTGTVTLTTPTILQMRTSLNLGSTANTNLDGNIGNVLKGDGSFGPVVTAVNTTQVDPDSVGFTLTGGVINTSGTVTLTVPAKSTLRNNLNIGTAANINLDSNTANYLRGDGTWGPVAAGGTGTVTSVATTQVDPDSVGFTLTGGAITTAGTVTLNVPGKATLRNNLNIGNVANANFDGNVGNVLRGDGTWGADTAAPAAPVNSVQFNNSGAFGGSAALTWDGTTLLTTDVRLTGNVRSSLLPNANVTFDLGSSTQRWKDIWLSNSTIYMGDGNIKANGSDISVSGAFAANGVVTATGANLSGNLTVAGVSNLGAVGNVKISGGTNGQFLQTDGNGNITWATGGGGGGGTPAGNTTEVQFNNAGSFGATSALTWDGTALKTADLQATGKAALGNGATATGANSFAIGAGANASNTNSIAIGAGANANFANMIAIGGSTSFVQVGNALIVNGASKLIIPGGANGQFLRTDGNGNLSWAAAGGGSSDGIANGTSFMRITTSGGNTVFNNPIVSTNNFSQMRITKSDGRFVSVGDYGSGANGASQTWLAVSDDATESHGSFIYSRQMTFKGPNVAFNIVDNHTTSAFASLTKGTSGGNAAFLPTANNHIVTKEYADSLVIGGANSITSTAAPISYTATGSAGNIRYDSNAVYVANATNSWMSFLPTYSDNMGTSAPVTFEGFSISIDGSDRLFLSSTATYQITGHTVTIGTGTQTVQNWQNVVLSTGGQAVSGAMSTLGTGCRMVFARQNEPTSTVMYEINALMTWDGAFGGPARWAVSMRRLMAFA